MVDSSEVKRVAKCLGFDLVGVTTAEPFLKFDKHVIEGIMSRRIPDEMTNEVAVIKDHSTACDPSHIMPGTRSVVVLGTRYLLEEAHEQGTSDDPRGRIARVHWRDFSSDLKDRRGKMLEYLRSEGVNAVKGSLLPIKPAACRSGVGVFGKNTMIQNEDLGSWLIFTAILTDAELTPDEQMEPRCGSCQRCIRLCPTKAMPEPYVLDASRCLNYVLASDAPIPVGLRELVGDRINGCDLCQEVCPRNENVGAVKTALPPRFGEWGKSPKLLDVLKMSESDFERYFSTLDWYSPSLRALKRNAIVALGNTGDCSTLGALEPFSTGEDEDLAEHARWAMDRISQREGESR
ncbi:MAG: tRNA epoxyqueuosine(34) reductase QueG [Methanomassiliicoccales archaeon]